MTHYKAVKISAYATVSWDAMWSHCLQLFMSQSTNITYRSVDIMTGMGVTCSFVAKILNICQYHLSVCLSDTMQMFKVRFETPGGVQGSGVCAAKKQWNQWHWAKCRERGQRASLLWLGGFKFLPVSMSHLQWHIDHMDLYNVTAARVADKATGCWHCLHRHVPC